MIDGFVLIFPQKKVSDWNDRHHLVKIFYLVSVIDLSNKSRTELTWNGLCLCNSL